MDKPVERLWLYSMTKKAITEAFEQPAPRRGDEPLEARRALALRGRLARGDERDPRRLDPPARRVRRRRLARPRADPDARARRAPRGGDPRLQARALLARRGEVRGRRAIAATSGATSAASGSPEEEATAMVVAVQGQPGDDHQAREEGGAEKPELLYDLTTLQRHANTLYGFSARRTLSAAQRLYEEHKAITYPRTSSRYLTGDMVDEIKPTAELVGHNPQYTQGGRLRDRRWSSSRSRGWSTTRRSRTTTRSSPRAPSTTSGRWATTSCRIYDLVAKRFLAVFHPEAKFERTRVETTVEEHVFRTSGRGLVEAGWRAVYGRRPSPTRAEDDSGRRPAAAAARAGRERGDALRRVDPQGDPAAAALHRRVAARARWRPRARRWTTPSCARP